MLESPGFLIPLSLAFPFLCLLNLTRSCILLRFEHISLLFENLPLLHTLRSKTRKPRINSEGESRGSVAGADEDTVQDQDAFDQYLRELSDGGYPKVFTKRRADLHEMNGLAGQCIYTAPRAVLPLLADCVAAFGSCQLHCDAGNPGHVLSNARGTVLLGSHSG